MPGFTESSITLDFPDNNFFRFADCQGYRKPLSAHHFKEMDACWYDIGSNLYWLFELKDFSLANLTTPETVNQRAWDLVKKAVDSLTMFLCSKHNYAYAADLNICFPAVPNAATQFKFVIL